MPSDSISFVVPLILGALISMAVEAVTGRAVGLVARQFFLRKARRRLRRFGDRRDLIRRGDEAMYVIEFVPDGWANDAIRLEHGSQRDLKEALNSVPEGCIPANAEEMIAMVEKERVDLANGMDGRWNGPSLGVEEIVTSRSGVYEKPTITIRTVDSDHAAATVATTQWEAAFDEGRIELPKDLSRPIPGMLNAIGLNATLVTGDGYLVLVKRSPYVDSGRSGFHISVNEGMLPLDRDNGRLDPHVGLVRGVREELGIEIQPRQVRFHTAMLDVRRYQFGLLGHIDLRGTKTTAADLRVVRQLGVSQDKFENTELVFVPWNFTAVAKVLAEPDWLAHGWLNLVHSAIAAFGSGREQLYELLGERTSHAARQGDAGSGHGADRAQRV